MKTTREKSKKIPLNISVDLDTIELTFDNGRGKEMSIDYSKLPHHKILCVDMKSFYASCSAVMLGLDPLTCHLAVVGNLQQSGSVVLAASPRSEKRLWHQDRLTIV